MTTLGSMFAGLKVWGQMRLVPTQKMSTEPTRLRLASAASVMTGEIRVASAVTQPWKAPTESAENTQPFPIEAAMAQTMMASIEPLRTSDEQSPVRPSWMEPTMAMAPTLTVSDAVTKPSTNRLSPLLPVRSRSHSPRRSKQPSMSATSPITEPTAMETTSIMVPVVESATEPFAPTLATSMCCRVPAMPTNMMQTPQARSSVSCKRSVTSELARSPMTPPTMTRATLMRVPRPGMAVPCSITKAAQT